VAPSIDLDLLAQHLASKMADEQLSLRSAAGEIGISPATLARLLKGTAAPNYPDSQNLFRAVNWLDRSISDFESGRRAATSSLADVEVHLRALPGLTKEDKDALVAMVRAAHDAAFELRKKKGEKRSRPPSA